MYRSVLDSDRVDMEIRNIYLFDHLSLVWSLSVLTCINAVNNEAARELFLLRIFSAFSSNSNIHYCSN